MRDEDATLKPLELTEDDIQIKIRKDREMIREGLNVTLDEMLSGKTRREITQY